MKSILTTLSANINPFACDIMALSNQEIQNALLFEQNHDLLTTIERELRARIKDMPDSMTKADLMGLLLIASLKKNFIETDQIRTVFDEYLRLIRTTAENLHRGRGTDATEGLKSTDMLYRIFVTLTVRRCAYIETLLSQMGADRSCDRVRIVRHSLDMQLAYREGKYIRFISYLFYKYSTMFGTSFLALFTFILACVFGFAGIMYTHDLMGPVDLISETEVLNTFDYYSYISLATFSNLGADTSFASNVFLRLLFGVEQIMGLVLFGVAIILLGRRFK